MFRAAIFFRTQVPNPHLGERFSVSLLVTHLIHLISSLNALPELEVGALLQGNLQNSGFSTTETGNV